MSEKKQVTLELTENNYKHLEEIAARFAARGIEEMATVEALIHYCLVGSFHALDVESYASKDLEPVTVNISGVVAVPPGTTGPGDIRKAAQLVVHRMSAAFPFNLLNVSTSAPSKRSKAVNEWRESVQGE